MDKQVFSTKAQMAQSAADRAAALLRAAIARQGQAVFVVATGASQFEFLQALTSAPGIDWSKTTMFHLDEYIGISDSHPASFRRYLRERLVERVHPGKVHFIQGDAPDLNSEIERLNGLIAAQDVDVALVGIGENGHLAFNAPPADFEVSEPYMVVNLDEACRRQQLGEGWFTSLEDVPRRAVSMSIRQIMRAQALVCTVPDKRKAQAVHDCFIGAITPQHPASILRSHPQAHLFLDADAASLLEGATIEPA